MANSNIRSFQKSAKYYPRRSAKRLQYFDGVAVTPEDLPALVTRYGFQPRNGQPKDAYVLHSGEWVEIASIAFEADEFGGVYAGNNKGHYFRRIEDRWLTNRVKKQTRGEGGEIVKVHVVDGRVVAVVGTEGDIAGLDLLEGLEGRAATETAHMFLGIPFMPAA